MNTHPLLETAHATLRERHVAAERRALVRAAPAARTSVASRLRGNLARFARRVRLAPARRSSARCEACA